MKCPQCDTDTQVIETRQHRKDTIRRRRKCRNTACGFRYTTEERLVSITPSRPPAEVALAVAQQRRQRETEARRQNEERQMLKDLGLTEDEESYDG